MLVTPVVRSSVSRSLLLGRVAWIGALAAVVALFSVAITIGAGGARGTSLASTLPRLEVTRFSLGAAPVAVTFAAGSVWVVEETSGMRASLVRIDATTGTRLAGFAIGRTGPDFGAATASGRIIWAAAGDHLIRVPADHPNRLSRVRLPGEVAALAADQGSVWVATIGTSHDSLVRLDSGSLMTRRGVNLAVQPVAIQRGPSGVWLASTGGLWHINPATSQLTPFSAPVTLPVGLASTASRLWVAGQDKHLTAIDPSGRIRNRYTLPFLPDALTATPNRIWLTNNCGCQTGRLALVNSATGQLLATQTIGQTPTAITADHTGVWVATFADESVTHVQPR
jgi:hypothetical protein